MMFTPLVLREFNFFLSSYER